MVHFDDEKKMFHPNAHPDCVDCGGRGVIKPTWFHIVCPSCIDVPTVEDQELGVGD